MIKENWLTVGHMAVAVLWLVGAVVIGSKVLLRSRSPELISPLERKFTSITASLAALLLLGNAIDSLWVEGSRLGFVHFAAPISILVHFCGVLLLHGKALARRNHS